MQLKYGKGFINFDIAAKNRLGVLAGKDAPVPPLDTILRRSITNPIETSRLSNLLRRNKPTDLVIIVSDITRAIANYARILQFLVAEVIDAGIDEKNIEFVIALGTHRPHNDQENKLLFAELIKDFKFTGHDCQNNLASIGKTSTGLEVQVNKRVWDADFVITTGKINFHYLAGFSGGRKSILPGIASYETIRGNHCKLRRDGVMIGQTKNNIIAQEMFEASQLFNVDYSLNVVETQQNQTAQIFWGNPPQVFEEGREFFESLRTIAINQRAECVVVSAGGAPQDKDFFSSHKPLNMAINALKPGGSILLIGQCGEGFGNKNFFKYLSTQSLDELLQLPEPNIELGGHRAYVTAKILKNHRVYVVSDLDPAQLSRMNFIPVPNVDEAMRIIRKEYGEEFKCYVMPEGTSVLPRVEH